MNRLLTFAAIFCLLLILGIAPSRAERPLSWFLDDIPYDASVPSPEEFFGFQVGEWHLGHTLLVNYMEKIAATSPRATIYEYARSHEFRPLVHLVITSEENQRNLEEIRERHLMLTNPELSADLDISEMPLIVFLGYGVHGNEPSAHNAAPLVAYYLAAGMDEKVDDILENMVVIIDPSLNPDGQDRFASWVNRHRGMTLNPDPNNREFRDVWPGSRTNHYWFDLNRDWLPVQHPESRGRIKAYHRWMPNINTDHHEFGSNSTFFFQPGEPARVNPRTPRRTDELTMDVAKFHAAAFDRIGQTYYTQQGFDDFYYGKGSSYPDVQGSIGILFEQASSRGHRRETIHGILDFAETIRNQVIVSMSTIEAGLYMRETLLDHLRWFFSSAVEEAAREDFKAYIFGDTHDMSRNLLFKDILKTHRIQFYDITGPVNIDGNNYQPGKAWLVPLQQPQYRLIQSIFEKALWFEDSLFYDVSTWTKPLAMNIPYGKISSGRQLAGLQGNRVEKLTWSPGVVQGTRSDVAYLFSRDDFYAPKALYYLQQKGLRTHVATRPFSMEVNGGIKDFGYGSIMVPAKTQDVDADKLYAMIQEAARHAGIDIYPVHTSLVREGIHLGSGSFMMLRKPEVLLLIGQGTNSREAGEVWHLLDQHFHMPVTKVELDRFSALDLSRYTVMVMPSGSYNSLGENDREKLNRWLRGGGTIVALGTANRWLHRHDFINVDFAETPGFDEPEMLPYSSMQDYRGARRISGSIFRTRIDVTHPLFYGYHRDVLPVHVAGTLAAKPVEGNPFANPMIFTEDALLSGYVWGPYESFRDNTAGVLLHRAGRGNIITMMNNPNFRGFWFGTGSMFMNAIFFGDVIRL